MKKIIALVLSITMLGTISVSAALPKYNQFNANGGKFYNTSNKKAKSILKLKYSAKPKYDNWVPKKKKWKYVGERVYKRTKTTVYYHVLWKSIYSIKPSLSVNKKNKKFTIKMPTEYTDVGDFCVIYLKNKKNTVITTKISLFDPEGYGTHSFNYTKNIKQIKAVFHLQDSYNLYYKTKTITKAV